MPAPDSGEAEGPRMQSSLLVIPEFSFNRSLCAGICLLSLAGSVLSGCGGSSQGSEVSGGSAANGSGAGSPVLQLPTGGDSAGGASGVPTAPPGTLPPGFTPTELGGFMTGAQLAAGGTGSTPDPGGGAGMGARSCGTTIKAVVRDFKPDGMTFEGPIGDDRGVVEPRLGADRKPVYARGDRATRTIAGPEIFNQFYRSTPGVNIPFEVLLFFTPNNGVTSFRSDAFFPIDGKGFGNDGADARRVQHNFHFTTEIHTQFLYSGGEKFDFSGDDDLWVFINNQLAIDLGGVHTAQNATVRLDAEAAKLGLTKGTVYPFDMFYNERRVVNSDFRADTDLEFVDCGTIVPDVPVK